MNLLMVLAAFFVIFGAISGFLFFAPIGLAIYLINYFWNLLNKKIKFWIFKLENSRSAYGRSLK